MSDEEMLLQDTPDSSAELYLKSLERLQELRRFTGEPAQFWNAFLRILASMADAASGAILARGDGAPERTWRILSIVPQSLHGGPYAERVARQVEQVEERHAREAAVLWRNDGEPFAAVRLETGEADQLCLAAFVLSAESTIPPREIKRRLLLASDVPAAYQTLRVASEAKTTVEHIAGVLDLMVMLNEKKRFLSAAMTFCNEISARMHCERVSIGWLDRGYIRLQATSHVDRFDRKSDAVHMLETAMEEAADQDCAVSWPEEEGEGAVTRDHRSFARTHDTGHVCSIPLRADEKPVGVCTCERTASPFTEVEMRLLRLFCDQAARRLSDLKKWDRWFGARAVMRLREGLAKAIGFEHTWMKVLGLILVALAAFLVFARVPYRITAPLSLKTDDIAVLAAPFAGHIEKVSVRIGDSVKEGDELLALDQTDLQLSQAQIVAEIESYRSEIDKARATNSLADMRIAQARQDQARARYNLVRYHLGESVVRAPFSGIVVEGDLQGRIGLPVRQGDTLFKVARIDRLYAALDVSEQDIDWIPDARTGEMALASRPQQVSPIRVTKIEPEAVPKTKGNVFRVDCEFPNGPQSWWRPGMTGVAKLNVGDRSPLWILTHRTADFLRLRLWW